ncbi:TetR/AcrR family transcriptional regulator [Winogradskya consettensis]|uniref:TetR family transcriptional regulator n=1 Tax=Winogradskya consettensis TaxID=113560 RepID=A0A919SCS3_9ACTN|nr:TetR/AcrR family transcriptional regulator C-terminal ligand-binding domain-containing protein [Actinoplanes consettensis]GIM70027.1 TetR family transcriptional regulator [Actinoplanes consettensis]
MAQQTGTARPGGRTARTRESVHAAVRELMVELPGGGITIADIATRSGVHQATIYRRWRSPNALLLDVAVNDLAARAPVPATGDLRADLTAYASRLSQELTRPGGLDFFRAIVAAAHESVEGSLELMVPRLDQFQAMLDASGTAELTPLDVFELILAPMYVRAMLPAGAWQRFADPATLVDNVLAVRDHRRS